MKSPPALRLRDLLSSPVIAPSFLPFVRTQVARFSAPPEIDGSSSNAGSTGLRRDCALMGLDAGQIPMPEMSVSAVALTLARV